MNLFRSREGDITAIDIRTQLSTLGSQSAPGPLLVPAGASRLAAVHVAFASDFAAANDNAIILRLEGPGLPEGPESITVGATGCAVATGGASTQPARRVPLDIPVTPANEILVYGEMVGEDGGTIRLGATLEFTS